jgi:hypothetical protein
MEGTSVVDTQPTQALLYGHGVLVVDGPASSKTSTATLKDSAIERSHDVAMVLEHAGATIDNVAIVATAARALDQVHGRGLSVQQIDPTQPASVLNANRLLLEGNFEFGMVVLSSEVTAVDLRIVDVMAQPADARFGDGIALSRGRIDIQQSHIEGAARVGIANFSGEVTLGSTSLRCNLIPLATQDLTSPSVFEDLGGNSCGCGDEVEPQCKAVRSELEPPTELD